MKGTIKSFIESFWFNAIMSVISVFALGEKVIASYTSESPLQHLVGLMIWLVLAFHFIRAAIRKRKTGLAADSGKPE